MPNLNGMRKFLTRCCLIAVSVLTLPASSSNAQPNSAISKKLSLPPLDSMAKGLHWRLWANQRWGISSVIQIDQKTDSLFSGKVVLYTQEAVNVEKELPTHRVYSSLAYMTPTEAARVADYLNQSHANEIPTDSLVNGWTRGMDGTVYTIECTNDQHYVQKHYWNPSAFPQLKEAVSIQRLLDNTKSILNVEARIRQFSNQIPFESWSGGMVIIKRNLNWFKKLKFKQERNAYRKRMHIAEKP